VTQLELLLDLGAFIQREVDLDQLLEVIGDRVARAVCAERATLWLVDRATGALRTRVADLPEAERLAVSPDSGVVGYVVRTGETVVLANARADERFSPAVDDQTGYRTESMVCVPIRDRVGRVRGALQALNRQRGEFSATDEAVLCVLAAHIARSLEHTSLRGTEADAGVHVRGRFNHVVGGSPAIGRVYDLITRAAATDATVMLRGETGTGKTLFARAIHVNSARTAGPFVHVDGTTLPASLVESELFGHERGAYTGADSQVIGQVERAAGGTLFIDEIGEIPLELQGKLLRFLQDRRFERVGGRETLEADVRIVVATNRDLAAMVADGSFREDLYYRIRVIDIELPTLRERGKGDIASLAEHFLEVYARRYRRGPLRLSERAKDALCRHRWPGNVRELEHAVERAVVLGAGPTLDADLFGLGDGAPTSPACDRIAIARTASLDAATRQFAQAVLDDTDGNRSEAARRLGISRNRLARLLADD